MLAPECLLKKASFIWAAMTTSSRVTMTSPTKMTKMSKMTTRENWWVQQIGHMILIYSYINVWYNTGSLGLTLGIIHPVIPKCVKLHWICPTVIYAKMMQYYDSAFLILGPPANTLSYDVTLHAVHFWRQGRSYLPDQRVSYLWLKERGRERGIWASALGWNMDAQGIFVRNGAGCKMKLWQIKTWQLWLGIRDPENMGNASSVKYTN